VVGFGESSSRVESELASVTVTPPWLLTPRVKFVLSWRPAPTVRSDTRIVVCGVTLTSTESATRLGAVARTYV
jgi:hypothetical protein